MSQGKDRKREARVAFGCAVAAGGAVPVVMGVNFQGVVWWFILAFVLGTLVEGGDNFGLARRTWSSVIVGAVFICSCALLFILTGVALSGYRVGPTGVDFFRIPERSANFLQVNFLGGYVGAGVLTMIMLWIFSCASSYTVEIISHGWRLSPGEVSALKLKLKLLTLIGGTVAAFVAYFAAR
jgi:hypothetical protein